MPNSLATKPIVIDTDITTYTGDAAVKALGGVQGVRVEKLVLAVGRGGASSAGTVSITAPSDNSILYPPMVVGAAVAANTILVTDNPQAPTSVLTWRDFKVTGLTATGTRLFLWVTV